jgi:hypothetical protein
MSGLPTPKSGAQTICVRISDTALDVVLPGRCSARTLPNRCAQGVGNARTYRLRSRLGGAKLVQAENSEGTRAARRRWRGRVVKAAE